MRYWLLRQPGFLLFKASRDFVQKEEAKEQYIDMRQETKVESVAGESETEKLDIPVDFEALQKKIRIFMPGSQFREQRLIIQLCRAVQTMAII